MTKSWDQALMGQRMKAAAIQAGLTQKEVALRLGVAPATVFRWWTGDRDPPSGTLLAYAQLVGKPMGYFFGLEQEEGLPLQLSDLLLQWAQRIMAGEEPGAAFDQVTGEPQELTPRERQRLLELAPQMREDLQRAAGGQWELLTEAEQRGILDQIAQLVRHRAGGR